MKKNSLQRFAEQMEISHMEIPLYRDEKLKKWISPEDGHAISVEEAVLAWYRLDGWRGYCNEGGLILNLIKAMSFEKMPLRQRSTSIESIYAQNVSFEEDRFQPEFLLANVATADKERVESNFDILISREPFIFKYEDYILSTSQTSMLDYFPNLERWMFVELLEVAGRELILAIAKKLMENPFEYRRGWPDITMWKGDELRFIEVKAPGDRIRDSQKIIISEFAKPLNLNFTLVSVSSKLN